jgi:stearoyl-CoA desaturase (delta-9 desaturase)
VNAGGARPSLWKLGLPFMALNLSVLGTLLVGWDRAALAVGLASYLARAFGITAFYHRYFSHRSFRVPRAVQLLGALLGAAAAQRGPLWWVGHHREHHLYTDRPGDPHSPVTDGFWYSHVLWIFDPRNAATRWSRVQDLARFPELVWLDRYEYVAPGALLGACAVGGALLGGPSEALRMALWGFAVPTVLLYHSTFAVNSLAHRFGARRFDTRDDSRNNWFVSALVLGEGWHNNHHRFPNSARQGLSRFELDPTWWGIRAMERLHLASSLRRPPDWALEAARSGRARSLPETAGSPAGQSSGAR